MALRSSNEITPLHLHAAALPRRFAASGRDPYPGAFPQPEIKPREPLEADWPRQTITRDEPDPVRETDPAAEAKSVALPVAYGGFIGFARFVTFSYPNTEAVAISVADAGFIGLTLFVTFSFSFANAETIAISEADAGS